MTRRSIGLLALAILLLGIVAYGHVAGFFYVQDSYHAVRTNPVVDRGDGMYVYDKDGNEYLDACGGAAKAKLEFEMVV